MGTPSRTYDAAKKAGMDYDALSKKHTINSGGKKGYDWKAMNKEIGEYNTTKKKEANLTSEKNKKLVDTADQSTVSGRIRKSAGMEGFNDPMIQDVIKGAQFGESVLGPEGLGRLGDSSKYQTKDDGTMAAMKKRAAGLAEGFSSAEEQARREKSLETITSGTQSQSRAMQAAMARSGVKGQAAGAQMGNIAMSGVQARGNLERDLTIANRQAQLQGLQAQSGIHAQDTANQQFNVNQALGVDKFDLGQAAKEKNIVLQSGLGFGQMGTLERGADAASAATIAAARAGKSSGGGGTSFVCSALRSSGRMTSKETATMLVLMLRAVLKQTKFLSWYFREAPQLADFLYSECSDSEMDQIKKDTVTDVMVLMEKGDLDAASLKYIREIVKLARKYGYTVKDEVEESSLLNTIKYLPSIFTLKSTWVWVKGFLLLKTKSKVRRLLKAVS